MADRPAGQPAPVGQRTLAWATAISLVIASIGLTFVILPSAYGIDPTGVGRTLGFEPDPVPASRTSEANDTFQIRLGPYDDLEFKLFMEKGDEVDYAWNTSVPVKYDMHGEPDSHEEPFESYDKGEALADDGALVASFTGSHGWYWENLTNETLFIDLTISGIYEIQGLR